MLPRQNRYIIINILWAWIWFWCFDDKTVEFFFFGFCKQTSVSHRGLWFLVTFWLTYAADATFTGDHYCVDDDDDQSDDHEGDGGSGGGEMMVMMTAVMMKMVVVVMMMMHSIFRSLWYVWSPWQCWSSPYCYLEVSIVQGTGCDLSVSLLKGPRKAVLVCKGSLKVDPIIKVLGII